MAVSSGAIGGSSDEPAQSAQKIYYAARDRAGITKGCGIHGLRHAFATHLLEAGTDVHTIQRLMGHGDIQTTMRYCHLAQQKIARLLAAGVAEPNLGCGGAVATRRASRARGGGSCLRR